MCVCVCVCVSLQLGSIDESSVEGLATVCEFSKVIRNKAADNDAQGE